MWQKWASIVKSLLYEHGFGNAWLNEGIGNPSHLNKMLQARLRRLFSAVRTNENTKLIQGVTL